MNKHFLKVFAVIVCVLFALSLSAADKRVKYVFLFIGDGMSTPQRMIAEEFSIKLGKGKLEINHMPFHGTTRTVSASSLVTDSAAAATAIACGVKTTNGKLGVDPQNKRLESVAEVAKKKGKKVGIITSVTINHATPGGFYAHQASRSAYYKIGLDLIASNFDYFGGGGMSAADKKKDPAYKGNLYELAKKAGYKVVFGRKGFDSVTANDKKVWAVGTKGALPYNITGNKDVPTLADFTRQGIQVLDNPNGFFMMVEGGAIDWAGHANVAAENLHEVLGFNEAVKVAMEFAKKHPDDTLIVVTGDHETGGMTMGFAGSGYNLWVERLTHQKMSLGDFHVLIKEKQKKNPALTFDDIKADITKNFGLKFTDDKKDPMRVNSKQLESLKKGFKSGKLAQALKKLINDKAGIGWTSGSHTALPVLTTSQGKNAEVFKGMIDNTDIAKRLKPMM